MFTQNPKRIIAIFFANEILEMFGMDIQCSKGGRVMDNVVLVVAPNNPMTYSKCGTVLARSAVMVTTPTRTTKLFNFSCPSEV